MRKVLRDYAKRKKGNLAIIGTIPVPTSKDKSPRLLAGKVIKQCSTIHKKEAVR
jgi:hypothetical protein